MSNEIEKALEVLSIEIPRVYHEQLVFLFMDGNNENWDAGNVTYKFRSGPIECPFYPGFYYVPGFSKYVISKAGELVRVLTGTTLKWIKRVPAKQSIRGGYVGITAKSDSGDSRNLSRHRAMALTFLDYDQHPGNFVINHKNGKGGDDRIENLEFCTYSDNTKHAYAAGLHANKTVAVDAWNWITGEVISFPMVQQCANYVGMPWATVGSRLSRSNGIRYEDGWRFKLPADSWLALNERVGQMITNRAVVARNIESGQDFVFGSIADASEHTGVKAGVIRTQCAEKVRVPVRGWNFRFLDDFSGWPKYSEQELAIFKDYPVRPGDGIEVHDLDTNEILFFTSAEKAGVHFGISPITASKLARYNGVRQKRFKFSLVRVRKDF